MIRHCEPRRGEAISLSAIRKLLRRYRSRRDKTMSLVRRPFQGAVTFHPTIQGTD